MVAHHSQSFPLLLWEQTLLQGNIWEPEGQWILISSQATGLGFLSVPQRGMSAGIIEIDFLYICIYMNICVYKAQCSSEIWAGLSYAAVTLQSFHFKTFSLGPNLSKKHTKPYSWVYAGANIWAERAHLHTGCNERVQFKELDISGNALREVLIK